MFCDIMLSVQYFLKSVISTHVTSRHVTVLFSKGVLRMYMFVVLFQLSVKRVKRKLGYLFTVSVFLFIKIVVYFIYVCLTLLVRTHARGRRGSS